MRPTTVFIDLICTIVLIHYGLNSLTVSTVYALCTVLLSPMFTINLRHKVLLLYKSNFLPVCALFWYEQSKTGVILRFVKF